MDRPTICLAMIVKNEEQDIKRCLDSVAKYIDYWVISDTGSTDNTMSLIKEIMDGHGVPGELHEHKWKDFSTNRNYALEIAKEKADFVWFMDADDNFVSEEEDPFLKVPKDVKGIAMDFYVGDNRFHRTCMVNSNFDWKYKGVLHEVLVIDGDPSGAALLGGCKVIARSSPTKRAETKEKKYAQDAKILLKEHKKNPKDTRTIFYLAQSYRDSKQYEKALKYYKMRLDYPDDGFKPELEVAAIEIAKLMSHIGMSTEKCVFESLKAWSYNPYRAEPAILAMEFFMKENMFFQAFVIGEAAAKIIDITKVSLYPSAYDTKVRFRSHYAYCCYRIGIPELAVANQEMIVESGYLEDGTELDKIKEVLEKYKKALNDSH